MNESKQTQEVGFLDDEDIVVATEKSFFSCCSPPSFSILGPPSADLKEDQTVVKLGDDIKIVCPIVAYPNPIITWTKDGEAINGYSWVRFRQNKKSLKIKGVMKEDAGTYFCKGTNGFGSDEVKVHLIVIGKKRVGTVVYFFSLWEASGLSFYMGVHIVFSPRPLFCLGSECQDEIWVPLRTEQGIAPKTANPMKPNQSWCSKPSLRTHTQKKSSWKASESCSKQARLQKIKNRSRNKI